jgi:hypothetical protein
VDAITPLLRIFYLQERAFSSFFNAVLRHPEIDARLAEWLKRREPEVISSLVSAELVYQTYPYDMIAFLNHRITESGTAVLTQKIEKIKEETIGALANKMASERPQEARGGADESKGSDKAKGREALKESVHKILDDAWNRVANAAAEEVKKFKTKSVLDIDHDLLDDADRERIKRKAPVWAWRYKSDMIEDFTNKLMFLIKARNSTMHGYLPKHATLEIIIETLADVFNSMQLLLGKHISKVPEGYLFMLGPLELDNYARGLPATADWKLDRQGTRSANFVMTSFNIRRETDPEPNSTTFWPTLMQTDRVWVSDAPLSVGLGWERTIKDLKDDIGKDKRSKEYPDRRLVVGRSRYIPIGSRGDFLKGWLWSENETNQPYACFWFAPTDS